MGSPTEKSQKRVEKLIDAYTSKSGTCAHPDHDTMHSVLMGLASNLDETGRPLCPCRFYPDKTEEIKHRTWICPCEDMQIYKYCHCLLFVTEEGLPITEYLPNGHEGRDIYGIVKDPTPDKGRPLRKKTEAREHERVKRPS
jgi:ferredoxin-thioredoxin reductase catalytic chain